MTTEKLSKAYLWRTGEAPPRSHTDVSDKIEHPSTFIGCRQWVNRRSGSPKAIKNIRLRLILPVLLIRPRLSLGTFVGNVHTGFGRFLKALATRRADQPRIAGVLGFGRPEDLKHWVTQVLPLAYSLQNIAPAEAGNGPNPEYPWPHEAPAHCPVGHAFPLWSQLSETGQGRKLLELIQRAVERFDQYA
jgi:hypothetical protein